VAAGIAQPPDAVDRFLAIYNRRLLQYTRPYPGIPSVLEALGGRAALAVLTNKPLGATREILAGLDLARHFPESSVLGGDGPFARKPEPGGLAHLVSAAGASAGATLLVGDSVIDWRTAHRAGTRICMARYGFGFEGFPLDQIEPGDYAIDAPIDLLNL
jgi:phosphoglycolate phosphatase-like HAD superfamily hydrolase